MQSRATAFAAILMLLSPLLALAQNPIQWNANARGAIERAREQQIPVMFWVTDGRDIGDGGDLRDAQAESFRDPIVVSIAEHHFVPVRISRNSRVLEEAQRLGLPTSHGLFVALVTAEGRVLDTIDPVQVANPEAFSQRLTAAFRAFRDDLYQNSLKGILTTADSPLPALRRALDTVWRLNILSADRDVVALLDRADLLPVERQRLYSLLASFATEPSVNALLARAGNGDREAASALGRSEAGALEFLVTRLPTAGSASPTQLAAYDAAAQILRMPRRPASFWTTARPEDSARELENLRTRAAGVLEYWQERIGQWR